MNTGEVPAHEMKLGALVVLLFFTLLCGFAPLCFVRGAGRCSIYPETRHRIVSLVSCFTGGVFLATCLLDLVPDYLNGINDAFRGLGIILQFPLPEFIIAMGFFLVLVLEQIVLALKSQSTSHSEVRHPLLVDPKIQSFDRDGWRLLHGREDLGGEDTCFHVDFNIIPAIRAFVLVFSLSLHSVFEGLAVGLQQHSHEVLQKCVGLLLHKSIISFSLALKLTQGKLRRAAVLSCLLLYAIMSPLGIVLGIAINDTKLPSQHHLAKSTLEGLASGTFMYITFMEILPHELSSQQNHMNKVAMLLSGFAVVTGVLFIKM
ncbi:zinc transporter ZIP1 [Esox lucius]|uniref:Solute carrier family 39 member 1 n=1 Tax=Esox lucius TaxID=8010 RepID=A0A3P8ZQX6_ESOLU|nr:zinc transporter ZIP1 [Esox lucius]